MKHIILLLFSLNTLTACAGNGPAEGSPSTPVAVAEDLPEEQEVRPDGTAVEVDMDPETAFYLDVDHEDPAPTGRAPAAERMAGSDFNTASYSSGKKKSRKGVTKRKRSGKKAAKRYPGSGGRGAKSAPIWNRFYKDFKKCAPDCEPANYGTWGSRGNRSCHPTGQAVDVGALNCGGKIHKAINRGRFDKFVSCMRGKMKTLYRNGKHITKGHHDHAHFSYGCTVGGKRWY